MLLKIKHIAVDRQTSVSRLLAKTLEEIVEKEDSYIKARQHHLEILEKGIDMNTKGEINWKRDDIHER
ncbi:MAG: CopG family transcriptional regulator [Firmicutes bacterium]|nr:CopG family transcriptional regulator [Bacillota bacterium]